ncbi:hypothetical protein PHYPO_G00239510 [Pangasianodon hypophthalmus]|uniref:Uncharacterized protein n=1 Tax=Pangasianodon hypophthalmus TaxID=310915 RepID=A0A5N5NE70_PANHP|nr:hypothetical protein PHYPO_G00239510 [Pangasianodon hypophthalmus]
MRDWIYDNMKELRLPGRPLLDPSVRWWDSSMGCSQGRSQGVARGGHGHHGHNHGHPAHNCIFKRRK